MNMLSPKLRYWLLPLILVPVLAYCATSLVQFSQLQAPGTTGLVYSNPSTAPNGQNFLSTVQLGTGLALNNGVLSATGSSVGGAPAVVVTQVTAQTLNNFPIPAGKTVCLVTRNIPQSLGIDYNVVAGAVVFIITPEVGDVVQLACW